jgi:hypothetical protein
MGAPEEDSSFSGEITVAARIIDLLSSGLYESPAACLKELINNSFDADASRVDVFVKPDANRIIIQDDGEGMDRAEFERHFRRIAESHKRDERDITASGRPKIGKIGIGVIAANELCEKLEIYSTKAGSTDLLHVTIDFEEMRKPPEDRRKEDGEFVKADYFGEVLQTEASSHYTHIFLTAIRGEARAILAGLEAAKKGLAPLTLYGKSLESMQGILRTNSINTWKDFDRYSETLLEVALNVPVQYFPGWLPLKLRKQLKRFEERFRKLDFLVLYDGMELRQPIVFKGDDRAFVKKFSFSGDAVAADGYFYAQHGSIKPIEIHGLLVRIRNVAVGGFDPSFWGFSSSEYSLIQRWVSCEIWADDRLEEAMNIDRKTLRVTHPAYVELRDAIHNQLRLVFSETRTRIYEAGSSSRKADKASESSASLLKLVRSTDTGLNAKTVSQITTTWKNTQNPKLQKALLRKYSVAELYAIVIEVAKQTLTAKQLEEFLRRLTERLSRD